MDRQSWTWRIHVDLYIFHCISLTSGMRSWTSVQVCDNLPQNHPAVDGLVDWLSSTSLITCWLIDNPAVDWLVIGWYVSEIYLQNVPMALGLFVHLQIIIIVKNLQIINISLWIKSHQIVVYILFKNRIPHWPSLADAGRQRFRWRRPGFLSPSPTGILTPRSFWSTAWRLDSFLFWISMNFIRLNWIWRSLEQLMNLFIFCHIRSLKWVRTHSLEMFFEANTV